MEEQTPENSTALTEDCGGNPCSTTLKNLYEYLDGALTAEEIQEIQRHLDACSHCTEAKDLEVLLRAKIKSSCDEQAPESLKARLLEHRLWSKFAAYYGEEKTRLPGFSSLFFYKPA